MPITERYALCSYGLSNCTVRMHVCRQSALSPSYIYFCTLFWLSYILFLLYLYRYFRMCCAP